uniref:FIP-RBD domain-containing protein n=1 Tax=Chelonoidis abingdonii TaxID=106734 RepID=A0A8C0GDJ2_CHEAB
MRSNMTASMFDLSMKDKSRSPFGKLKGKLKGKRASGLPDTASAIIPKESPEREKKKSKIKTLFSKPGLQKTSLSQSMSVLPAFQPVTEKVRLKPGDFQSKWGEDDDDDESFPPNSESETASADNKQLNEITSSNTKKEGLSLFSGLKSKNDPTPRSNVCINGNHVYRKESETKKETMPKDNTPSSSPQTFRKNQLSESEENPSSKSTKEHEKTGRMSPSRGLSGSHSLESFKSMTLPSYKLLSGGDLLGNSASLSLETAEEETKEDKKQENKKSALLSLVTGRKEVVKNDVENMSDMTLKEREVKFPEEKKNEKEVKSVEIPKDYSQESTPKNSNIADVPRNKKSHNPFDESLMEEQKPDKSAASSRTIQTKAVKPRPHPVKPMNTTTNKSHTKNLTTAAKMDENWTESTKKKYDPSEPAYAYAQLTHDELIQLVLKQKDTITKRDVQVRELENYIDNLLVRVMEETPNILRAPSPKNMAGRM